MYLNPDEECVRILIAIGSILWETSNLFTIGRYQLMEGHQTQCLFYNYQLMGICFYMPIFFFPWAVLMSTHETVTAPLGLMNPYNCCTNILNLIACNVVNTLLSVPIRRAVAWIIQNSGKPKIIYVSFGGPYLTQGYRFTFLITFCFRLVGKFIFIW